MTALLLPTSSGPVAVLGHPPVITEIPCHWSGDLSLAEANRAAQEHRECEEGIDICRVRRTAHRVRTEAGVLIPDSHRRGLRRRAR